MNKMRSVLITESEEFNVVALEVPFGVLYVTTTYNGSVHTVLDSMQDHEKDSYFKSFEPKIEQEVK